MTLIQIILSGLVLLPTPVMAESELDRVLRLVESRPDLDAGQIFLNVAGNTGNASTENNQVTSAIEVQQFFTDLDPDADSPLVLNLDAKGIGATNTGLVHVTTAPGASLLMANAAETQGHVVSSVQYLSNAPLATSSKISTSAIGSANSGIIRVTVSGPP